jgi:carboxylesterase
MRDWYHEEIYQPFALAHDGARTGALLLHGFTGSPADMCSLGELLHGRGIDAHAMRLPGMAADIERLNDMTAATWRQAALDQWVATRQRYERTIIVGYSMGGALALHAAAAHPPDLLILVAPLVRMSPPIAEALPVAKRVVRRIRPFARVRWDDPRVHDWFRRALPAIDTADPAIQAFLSNDAVIATAVLDELRLLARDALRRARSVTTPTVIVQGIADRIVLPRHSRALAVRMGGMVSYREVAGNHFLPLPSFEAWPGLARVLHQELDIWCDRFDDRA